METLIITIITAVLASSGVWAIVLYLVQRRDKVKENARAKDSAEGKMLMALAHDRLYYLLGSILNEYQVGERKGLTQGEFENIKILYDSYRNIGGNGTAEKLYEEVATLPIFMQTEVKTDERKNCKQVNE